MQTYELDGTLVGIKRMHKRDVPEVLDLGIQEGQFKSLGATEAEKYASIDRYVDHGNSYVAMVKGSVIGFLLGYVADKARIDYLSANMKKVEELLVEAAVKQS
ncbi:MAG TPA: hypothetical protein VI968_01380 [archaeon]|nr:hypothetical protein [archaeon]